MLLSSSRLNFPRLDAVTILMLTLSVALLGSCGKDPQSVEPTEEPTVTETESVDPEYGKTIAAMNLIRSKTPQIPEEIGSIPIETPTTTTTETLAGGALHVYTLRTTDTIARLEISITHPTTEYVIWNAIPLDAAPTLEADGKIYRPLTTQLYDGDEGSILNGQPKHFDSEPHRAYVAYPPLPKGIKEVKLATPWSTQTLNVKVEYGADELDVKGTKDVPILARVAAYERAPQWLKNDLPAIITVHKLTRIEQGVLLHYSLDYPKGIADEERRSIDYFDFLTPNTLDERIRLIDMESQEVHYALTGVSVGMDVSNIDTPNEVSEGKGSYLGWVLFPYVPEGVQTISAVIAGQLLFDLPISNQPLEDAVPERSYILLGSGWQNPFDPQYENYADLMELLDPEKNSFNSREEKVDPIIVPVTEGAVTTIGKGVNLDASVLFDVDKADLTPAALEVIDKAVAKIKEAEKTGIKKELAVVGHTDSVDEDAYNLELSKRRAEAVATALKTALPGWQITTDGKGETQPIASNDTDEGKALNRRVEIAWSK